MIPEAFLEKLEPTYDTCNRRVPWLRRNQPCAESESKSGVGERELPTLTLSIK